MRLIPEGYIRRNPYTPGARARVRGLIPTPADAPPKPQPFRVQGSSSPQPPIKGEHKPWACVCSSGPVACCPLPRIASDPVWSPPGSLPLAAGSLLTLRRNGSLLGLAACWEPAEALLEPPAAGGLLLPRMLGATGPCWGPAGGCWKPETAGSLRRPARSLLRMLLTTHECCTLRPTGQAEQRSLQLRFPAKRPATRRAGVRCPCTEGLPYTWSS